MWLCWECMRYVLHGSSLTERCAVHPNPLSLCLQVSVLWPSWSGMSERGQISRAHSDHEWLFIWKWHLHNDGLRATCDFGTLWWIPCCRFCITVNSVLLHLWILSVLLITVLMWCLSDHWHHWTDLTMLYRKQIPLISQNSFKIILILKIYIINVISKQCINPCWPTPDMPERESFHEVMRSRWFFFNRAMCAT